MVCGALILEGFDEGLDIVAEAEEGAGLTISSKAYHALMRLAQAEDRPLDVLALLGRTSVREVERTEGLLLSAMQAAAAVEDWGAVARLYTEMSSGPAVAAELALELEILAADASLLSEMPRSDGAAEASSSPELSPAEALSLALRAHCERGDVKRAVQLIERKRARGTALTTEEYARLADLTKRAGSADVLLALRPVDFVRTFESVSEPASFAVTNRAGVLLSSLGTVERRIAVGFAVGLLAVVALALGGGLGALFRQDSDPFDF